MSISARLQRVLRDGNLTVADLARWFDRPYPTVDGWVKKGLMPRGGPRDGEQVLAELDNLERLLRRKKLPVPAMPAGRRQKWLEQLKAG